MYTRMEDVCVSVTRQLCGKVQRELYSDIIYSTWADKFVSELHTSRYLQLAYLSPHSIPLYVLQTQRGTFSRRGYFIFHDCPPSTRTPESLSRDDELAGRLPPQSAAIINNKISKPAYISLIIHGTILTRAQS